MNKYNARKVQADGITFDSFREYNRYCELKLLASVGKIYALEVHKVWDLQEKFVYQGKKIRAITYESDFTYIEAGVDKVVIEDVKGVQTEAFKIKWKMLMYKYKNAILRITK